MSHAKKILIAVVALLVPFSAISATAQAAGETASVESSITARSGSLFKESNVSSNLGLNVVVTPGAGQIMAEPLKNVKVTFPAGMTFNPNRNICPDSKLNAQSPLGTPAVVVNSCANAVVGTGTATILLARFVANALADPVLVAFNGGRNNSGQPILKIYGFSKGTGVGILMTGTLNGRVLDIAVPVLSYDSAVANFNLNFPGEPLNRPDIGINTRGLDANYVQARCANGRQVTNAVFQLGQRDAATGAETGPTTTIEAPQSTRNCNGQAGRARLNGLKISGPNAVRNGRQGNFRITVRNPGTAIARNVVVRTNRGGNVRIGQIAPGATRNARINVRIRGNRNSRVAVRFTVRSSNANNVSQVRRVRVR